MSIQTHRPLVIALSSAIALLVMAPHASAQNKVQSIREADQRARNISEHGEDSGNENKAKQADNKPAMYPNATRAQPEIKVSPKMSKQLQVIQQRYEKEDWPGVIAKVDEVAADNTASAYEKAFAFTMAGNASANSDNQARAAEYFTKAIEVNGLENDNHYSTMYNLAVIQFDEEKYAEALATMDRFLAETKSDKPEHLAFRAGILANMNRYDEAAAIYTRLIAKNPTDKRVLMNAVAALQNGDKFDEANTLLEDAYKRGLLTEPRELRALYVGYMNAQRWSDAQKVIEDGVAKGVLQAGPDLARDYQVLAQTAYMDDKIPLAIEMYKRAAPMAADGEAYLNLAKVLDYAGKKAEAKAAAKQALEKGVKKPEDANRILAH